MGKNEEWIIRKPDSSEDCYNSPDSAAKLNKKILDKFPYADIPDKNGVKDGKLSAAELEVLPNKIFDKAYSDALKGNLGEKYREIKEKDPEFAEKVIMELIKTYAYNETVNGLRDMKAMSHEICPSPAIPQSNAKRTRL